MLPSTEWKRQRFPQAASSSNGIAGETISLGIGQGYNSFTPIQLAHAIATLANNGVVMKPHLVRDIENPITTGDMRATVRDPSDKIAVKPEHIDVIKRAMVGVDNEGTASQRSSARSTSRRQDRHGAGLFAAGRELQGPRGRRASARPRAVHRVRAGRHPKIALALIVENGGFGAEAGRARSRARCSTTTSSTG